MQSLINAGMAVVSTIILLYTFWSVAEQPQERHRPERRCHSPQRCSYHGEGRGHNPNSERGERFDTLPHFRESSSSETDGNCSICLEPLYLNPQHTLPCNHRLHSGCYQGWQAQSNTCPICRGPL